MAYELNVPLGNVLFKLLILLLNLCSNYLIFCVPLKRLSLTSEELILTNALLEIDECSQGHLKMLGTYTVHYGDDLQCIHNQALRCNVF